ncbi:MAG: hypothetical protein V1720_19755 [bacterium]
MIEKVVRKISLHDKRNYDLEYWLTKTPEERLIAGEELRNRYKLFLGDAYKGFHRILRIIKRSSS